MPFTPSHAAIVLPLLRSTYFSATALIIGSMAPDFEYFLTMNDKGFHGHTLPGLFYFDLPITFLAAFLFHGVVKHNLINNLPYVLQSKFQELKQFRFTVYIKHHWFTFSISALVGAASHLFWDSFTHPDTWAVNSFAIYDKVIPIDGARYPFYYVLQHVSSYVGLTMLLIYLIVFMKPAADAVLVRPSIWYWIILIGISVVIVFIRFYWWPETYTIVTAVISSISALCIASITAGVLRFSKNLSGESKF